MGNEKSVMSVIRAARPTFRNDHDKAAFAVHASFFAAGYALVATGPDALSRTPLSSPSTDEVGIEHWNELEDEYAFLYSNPEKGGTKVLVKCLKMNDKLMVDALADGASEPVHLKIDVKDYVPEKGGSKYSTQFKNLDKLVKNLNKEVLINLDGSSSKESSSGKPSRDLDIAHKVGTKLDGSSSKESSSGGPSRDLDIAHKVWTKLDGSSSKESSSGKPSRGDFGSGGSMLLGPNDCRRFDGRDGQPGFPRGRLGVPPGGHFDPSGPTKVYGFRPGRFAKLDRLVEPWRDISQPDIEVSKPTRVPVHPSRIVYPPVNPTGGSDLVPGPGAGVYPTWGDIGSGGSMHLGPNDLRWFGGEDWQPGVLPGARFDPYGPPKVPGFDPGRFARRPRSPPGGTHPDLQHFRNGSGFI